MKVYNWAKLPSEEARRGVVRCAFQSPDVMIVHHFLHPGMETKPHVHDFDQVVTILDGECSFTVDGVKHVTKAGDVFNIPKGSPHFAEVTGKKVVETLDLFVPPRKDYAHLVSYLKNEKQAVLAAQPPRR